MGQLFSKFDFVGNLLNNLPFILEHFRESMLENFEKLVETC